jgi:outer membrane lipoprotein-sorting protein
VLDVAKTYTDVRLRGTERIDGEETYIVELKPSRGAPVTWHVSRGTGRLLQTESAGKITTFTDYRDVDGELVAYRTTTQEPLGEVVVDVKQVRFNVDLPAGAFGPRRLPAAR